MLDPSASDELANVLKEHDCFPIKSYLQCNELTLAQLPNLTPQQWKNLSDDHVFRVVIVPENKFSVEEVMSLSDPERAVIAQRFRDGKPFRRPTIFSSAITYFTSCFRKAEIANNEPVFNAENGMR